MNANLSAAAGHSRRDFLRGALLAAGALARPGHTAPAPPHPDAAKLYLAAIGCGGKGSGDITMLMDAGLSIGALCDVDEEALQKMAAQVRRENNRQVRLYRDFREMLEKERDRIHAVSIATPDHMHAPAAALALSLGKHVYCQKPLTRTIREARRLRELAQQHGVVTQMGNQGSAAGALRRGVEVLQAGLIGPVREVHAWSNQRGWPQGIERPARADRVPRTLDWNLWLGGAPQRPFADQVYHPFKWRGWHDFGTGALGDMACHSCNLAFRALNLGHATEVEAETEGGTQETYPKQAQVRFRFPARPSHTDPGATLPPLTLTWYEGGREPCPELLRDVVDDAGQAAPGKLPGVGCYCIGDKGRFFSGGDLGLANLLRLNDEPKLRSITRHEAALAVPETLPRSSNHYHEWVEACVVNKPGAPYSRFELAARLTECLLLGCLAQRLPGRRIQWDGPNMRSPNTPEAAPLVTGTYRPGWSV
jgi:predicted dehydrogenase